MFFTRLLLAGVVSYSIYFTATERGLEQAGNLFGVAPIGVSRTCSEILTLLYEKHPFLNDPGARSGSPSGRVRCATPSGPLAGLRSGHNKIDITVLDVSDADRRNEIEKTFEAIRKGPPPRAIGLSFQKAPDSPTDGKTME